MICDGGVCTSRLVLVVQEPEHRPLRSGTYEFALTIDGEQLGSTCEVVAATESASCTDLARGDLTPIVVDDDDGRRTIVQIAFEEPLPQQVSVAVTHDQEIVVDRAFAPHYAPADPGCDDDCVSAKRVFVLDR